MFLTNLTKNTNNSKVRIKRSAEIGSLCVAPLSSILQDSLFFSNILIHLIKLLPKP